jgi:hypothetical protein
VEKVKYGQQTRTIPNILQKNDISLLDARAKLLSPASLRVDFSVRQMPFFCREELKYEKMTGIPLRFRVGSLQECDWLEQKPNALPPMR